MEVDQLEDGPTPEEAASEAQALADAQAGYNRTTTRGDTPPVEEPEVPADTQQTDPEPAPAQAQPAAEAQPAANEGQAQASVAEELASLKQRVQEMASASADPAEIRRLHGEIGNINRTLKQLQSGKGEPAPTADELDTALQKAEKAAEEFPEIAGPLVQAIKAMRQVTPTGQAPAEELEARITAAVTRQREADAMQTLAEEHPDWVQFRETDGYKQWLASKDAAYQQKFTSTWNPVVVAKGLTEAKEWVKAQQRKTTRLAGAVTPRGVSRQAGPTPISDEQAAMAGYNRVARRRA